MFFSKEEMSVAEDLAWKMLDEWNHAYMPNLEEYAYFYYNGTVIMDPWMNEKSQGLLWPDHDSKEIVVDPVSYYGLRTIENYVVRLFMLRPEWNPNITEKIKRNLTEDGRLKRISTIMPIVTYIAMSEAQADEEGGYVSIEDELPDSKRVYFEMVELPSDLIHVNKNGWEKEIEFHKKDTRKALSLLYPNGINFNYRKMINRVMGNYIRIIGFGD